VGRISFWHPRYRSEAELVYCDDVPKGQVVESGLINRSVEEEMHDREDVSYKNYIYHATKTLRAALLNQESNMPWPPCATDIKEENVLLPNAVYNLLAWILTDDSELGPEEEKDEKVDVKEHSTQRLVLSLGQDLLYNATKGRKKTAKHVALPLTVKNLTGCKEVITLLNRYGHGISYEQVLVVETKLAENQLEREEHGVILPKNVHPNVFSTFCWDNIY